ncbi:hypothetical protein G3I59_08710 [Amycolatopsis rubida]|uniref:Guanylate cyclase domain-containing protein n=1 Tax=Amycolatopsis rubida TaxID=112413 RepID=A0ABX0BJI7_9PSEU|nr:MULTISPECIES: hypothetical protein [Amycolatopsis]MYW90690.1 hypothetical protein [Amycolatopsis rubida]NEC55672.1 hypothetical protein [Amycolatopsis rubida]OAP23744.1 hypothetical protein A4R44_05605 [Amycolatopsis sp. M39]
MSAFTSSHYAARTRAVIVVDIVGSSRASDDLLDPMKSEMESLLAQALATAGLSWDEAGHPRETGDGAMLAFPDHEAGRLVEVVFHLDHLLRSRNRYHRFPMRARVAVHLGPMADDRRYHRTYITLTRLLNSAAFVEVVRHWCHADPAGERFGAALVMSEAIWRAVVEPFTVGLVPPARCAPIHVSTADFTGDAWIHLPGLDTSGTVISLQDPPAATPLPPLPPQGLRLTPLSPGDAAGPGRPSSNGRADNGLAHGA